eukprot:2160362-Lingulodinium_polyedra.AAC.1
MATRSAPRTPRPSKIFCAASAFSNASATSDRLPSPHMRTPACWISCWTEGGKWPICTRSMK